MYSSYINSYVPYALNILKIAYIQTIAFPSKGNTYLAITMGLTAPVVSMQIFWDDSLYPLPPITSKTVTVRIPAGATGYGASPTDTTTNNWGNAFRGKGWNGSDYQWGTVDSTINLIIQNY